MEAHYDDSNLYKLFEQLDRRKRMSALKGAFRRASTQVRRTAVANLRGTGINHTGELSKGVRAVVFKSVAGFRVTVGSKKANKQGKGERGMYMTRKQGKKPVLIWLENGTKMRRSKRSVRAKDRNGNWFTTGTNRGQITRYGFMAKTADQVSGGVTQTLHREIIDNITRVAKKYGCK